MQRATQHTRGGGGGEERTGKLQRQIAARATLSQMRAGWKENALVVVKYRLELGAEGTN